MGEGRGSQRVGTERLTKAVHPCNERDHPCSVSTLRNNEAREFPQTATSSNLLARPARPELCPWRGPLVVGSVTIPPGSHTSHRQTAL